MNNAPTLHQAAPMRRAVALAAASLLVVGCGSIATPNPALERAHASQTALQNDPQSRQLAPSETLQAEEAVRTADAAWARKESAATVEHLAYLAQQRIAIARETASTKTWEKQAQATLADTAAERARQDRGVADRDLAAARRNTQDKTVELAAASAQAQQDKARASDLQAQLRELNARQTDRGEVVTLGDVLFDTNRAQLRSGAPGMGKLVEFLQRHPQRTVVIEGFTDSQGSASANMDLSQRRAGAVRDALIEQGVGADRLSARGYGDARPASTNDTAAGRQMNRRVEIVLSAEDGRTPAR